MLNIFFSVKHTFYVFRGEKSIIVSVGNSSFGFTWHWLRMETNGNTLRYRNPITACDVRKHGCRLYSFILRLPQ